MYLEINKGANVCTVYMRHQVVVVVDLNEKMKTIKVISRRKRSSGSADLRGGSFQIVCRAGHALLCTSCDRWLVR
jgi:hypothetical protein